MVFVNFVGVHLINSNNSELLSDAIDLTLHIESRSTISWLTSVIIASILVLELFISSNQHSALSIPTNNAVVIRYSTRSARPMFATIISSLIQEKCIEASSTKSNCVDLFNVISVYINVIGSYDLIYIQIFHKRNRAMSLNSLIKKMSCVCHVTMN